MLAELAAANAAISVIRQAVSNGSDLARCAKSIGQLVGAKEQLERKVKKKKAAHQTTDFEEFMALERIREQEEQLKQIMIYAGRPGLLADWQKFQKDARVARRQAEIEAARRRERIIEYIGAGFLGLVLLTGCSALVWWALWLKGIVEWP